MPPAPLLEPLLFTPLYKVLVWGGRRMERWRRDLPDGPIGESWDLADHANGTTRVAEGAFAGRGLDELTREHGAALVGAGFDGGPFPLLVKLIDATDRLSVQVHPDDELARRLGVGANGKTECWLSLDAGGEIFLGTRPGVDRAAFERALAGKRLETVLNRFETWGPGDFFFLPARTVHALGRGSLVYEVQQTSDITFRVYDWDRVGLDGKPRPLHVRESLETIDFGGTGFGPRSAAWEPLGNGEYRVDERRRLVDCPYFTVEELRVQLTARAASTCAIITSLDGPCRVSTSGGAVTVEACRTALVPAAAGAWTVESTAPNGAPAHLLVSCPKLR